MEILNQIRDDYESGAGHLALRSCELLRDVVGQGSRDNIEAVKTSITDFCHDLYNLRPSMVNISNAASFLFELLNEVFDVYSASDPIPALVQRIDQIIIMLQKNTIASAHNMAGQIPEGASILTHSKSLSVAKSLDLANEKNIKVYVTESCPIMEGRKMADELNNWIKLPAFVITDAEMSHFIKDVDMVIVGCDSILPDGSVVNKIGTSTIALCAHEYGKPFYSVGDTFKISSRNEAVALEEAPTAVNSKDFPEARNVYFDKTNPQFIKGIVTERGIMDVSGIREVADYWLKLERKLQKSA